MVRECQTFTDFVQKRLDEKLPRELRYLGMALRCKHPIAERTWHNDDNLRQELRRQGNARQYVDAVMTQTLAEKDLV